MSFLLHFNPVLIGIGTTIYVLTQKDKKNPTIYVYSLLYTNLDSFQEKKIIIKDTIPFVGRRKRFLSSAMSLHMLIIYISNGFFGLSLLDGKKGSIVWVQLGELD